MEDIYGQGLGPALSFVVRPRPEQKRTQAATVVEAGSLRPSLDKIPGTFAFSLPWWHFFPREARNMACLDKMTGERGYDEKAESEERERWPPCVLRPQGSSTVPIYHGHFTSHEKITHKNQDEFNTPYCNTKRLGKIPQEHSKGHDLHGPSSINKKRSARHGC